MEINYDPTFNNQKELLDRLENLEGRIMSYITSGVAIPPEVRQLLVREINLIGGLINRPAGMGGAAPPLDRAPKIQSSRTGSGEITGRGGDSSRVHSSVFSRGTAAATNYNEDAQIRPGFIMTDEQIQHRGSAAAFNTGVVGGLDYQKRAMDLCRQIRSAGLGDPTDFGCITNPGEVSQTYSWRGNFKMVCDRLGDTWGSGYPEMMGCLPNK